MASVSTPTELRLQSYLDAEAKILSGQEFRMGDRSLRMADLEMVQKQIALLQAQVSREANATAGRGGRFSQATFGYRG